MQNPFSKLTGLFQRAAHSGESVIGIDIGSAYLKVVQLRRKAGRAVLETYGSLALGPYGGLEIGRAARLPVERLSEALRDLCREAHVTTTRAGVAIPFASSLVTPVEMLVLSEKELAEAIPIEARKYVPVPISEVSLDWWVIPDVPSGEGPEGTRAASGATAEEEGTLPDSAFPPSTEQKPKKVQVLLAAIHNEAMSRFAGIASGARINASFFEIELFSTVRALLPGDNDAHALLDLGASESKLYIIDRSLLRLSHTAGRGSQELTLALSRAFGISVETAEKQKRAEGLSAAVAPSLTGMLGLIFAEAGRAVHAYEKRSGRKIQDLVLSGGGANLIGIEEMAAETSSVPVYRAHPFKQVEAPAFLEDVLSGVGPEFSVAIGAAFRALQEGA